MLKQATATDRQLRDMLEPLGLLNANDLIRLVEAFKQLSWRGPCDILRTKCLPQSKHRKDSARGQPCDELLQRHIGLA